MKKHFLSVFISLFLVTAGSGMHAQEGRGAVPLEQRTDRSEKRTALIIGNSAYREAPLANPVNDATDMAAALKTLGFAVELLTDARRAEMIAAIRRFGEKLQRDGGVGLFFFAGHGIQLNGRNYLLPVDADIRREHEVEDEAVNVGRVLGEMDQARNRLNIVVLDACRNNPYERSFRSMGRGLASIDAPRGTLIAYATAPGSVAADGSGRNSPYSAALLENIPRRGEPVERVFKKVRAAVINKTNGAQIPWESSSLIGEFYFAPGAPSANTDPPPAEPVVQKPPQKTTTRPEASGTASPSSQRATNLRAEPQFVDLNQLPAIARSLQLDVKRSGTSFDPNTVELIVLGKGRRQEFQFAANGKIVHDRQNGLMWEQSGSKPARNEQGFVERWGMNYQEALAYVARLNANKFGGYDNWRLPTLAEALTLMTPPDITGRNDLRIDTDYFDTVQTAIWTADQFAGNRRWTVSFEFGQCDAVPEYYEIPVRAVRSVDGTVIAEFADRTGAETNREQTRSAASLDITGYWYDAYGTVFEISKIGTQYNFAALNVLTGFVSQGTVTLSGQRIATQYQTNLPSFGRSEGTISADGETITVTVYDSVQGTYVLQLSRRAPY